VKLAHRQLLVALALLAAFGCTDDDEDEDTSEDAKCDAVVEAISDCYDGYCNGAGMSVPFCQCWNNGQDINISTCECMTLDLDAVCQVIDLDAIDPNAFNCAGATDAVSQFCD
jgi:hypothetical protein